MSSFSLPVPSSPQSVYSFTTFYQLHLLDLWNPPIYLFHCHRPSLLIVLPSFCFIPFFMLQPEWKGSQSTDRIIPPSLTPCCLHNQVHSLWHRVQRAFSNLGFLTSPASPCLPPWRLSLKADKIGSCGNSSSLPNSPSVLGLCYCLWLGHTFSHTSRYQSCLWKAFSDLLQAVFNG